MSSGLAIAEAPGSAGLGEQLADVRSQLPGDGIDDLELFFDADGEHVGHGRGL